MFEILSDPIFSLLFIVGLLSAYFGSFTSGGVSVLGIGLMTLLGIPPQMATITFKLGKLGDTLGGVYLFYKNGHIPKGYVLGGGLVCIVGSYLGTSLIFSVSDSVIYGVSALSMLVLTIVSWYKKVGIRSVHTVTNTRKYLYFASLFCLNIVGNIFIAGSGVWYHFANTFILRLSSLESKGIATAISFFWVLGTLVAILQQGVFNLSWAFALGIGMFIGGYFGTKHIIKLGNETFRHILLGSIGLFAFYFLYLAWKSW